jgi:hypothetical protein
MRATRLRRALGAAGLCLLPLVAAFAPPAFAGPPRGYLVLSTLAFTAPSGTVTHGEIQCSPGLVPFGGGVFIVSGQTTIAVHGSYPTATGWAGDVDNSFGSQALFDIEVVCAHRPRHYALVQARTVPNPSGAQSTEFARCPASMLPLGGGARTDGTERAIDLNSSLPVGHRWRVDVNNATSTDSSFSVLVVCGRLKGYAVVTGTPGTAASGAQARLTATCPAPTVPVGGGVYSATTDLRDDISSTLPIEDSWVSVENNGAAVSELAVPYAICAGT